MTSITGLRAAATAGDACYRAPPTSADLLACLREMGRWRSPPTRRMIEVASVAAVDVATDAKATSATAAKARAAAWAMEFLVFFEKKSGST